MQMLKKLEHQGFKVRRLEGDALSIWPSNQLTDATRQWIKQHRAVLIKELSQEEKAKAAWLRKGLSSEQSDQLLKVLQRRDADVVDNRRSCAECQHFYLIDGERMRCRARLTPFGWGGIYILRRCKGFIEG